MNTTSIFWRRFGPCVGALVCVGALSACGGGGSTSAPLPTATPLGTPGASPTATATAGSLTGLLVFAFAPEGADAAQTDIFTIVPNGTQLRRLTTSVPDADGNLQPQGSPALSPDRSRVVYVSVASVNGQSQSQLRVINADGTGGRALGTDANLSGATAPTWSPDGTRIAFSRGNDGIFIVNADGTGVRQLTTKGANPSWSIANKIAFNAASGVQALAGGALKGRAAIKRGVLPPGTSANAGSGVQALAGGALRGGGVKRGTRGVLPPGTSAYTDIWTVGVDGSGLRQLTQQTQTDTGLASINPAWSPDGQTLVFNSVPGSGVSAQLFLMGADGSNRRTLGAVNGTDPAWSPDGKRIVYSSETGLSTVGTDGSNAKLVSANDELFVEDTDWR